MFLEAYDACDVQGTKAFGSPLGTPRRLEAGNLKRMPEGCRSRESEDSASDVLVRHEHKLPQEEPAKSLACVDDLPRGEGASPLVSERGFEGNRIPFISI